MNDFWSGILTLSSAILIAAAFRERKEDDVGEAKAASTLDVIAVSFALTPAVAALAMLAIERNPLDTQSTRVSAGASVTLALVAVVVAFMYPLRSNRWTWTLVALFLGMGLLAGFVYALNLGAFT